MGYRGELLCKFKITTDALPTIYQPGDKIAQLLILPYPNIEPEIVEDLAESDRGDNGFGSTDNTEKNETTEQGRDSGISEGSNQSVQ